MQIGQFGIPGQSTAVFTDEREIFWGGDASRIEILQHNSEIDSTASDAGASPTTTIRSGLLLGRITSSGRLKQWDPTASDGTQHLFSVNRAELVMVDPYQSAVSRFAPTVVRAPLKASQLLILGAAFVGHAYEYLARRALALRGCILDDDPHAELAGLAVRDVVKTATGTVAASENGATIYVNGAGAVTLTLPAIKAGLRYRFVNIADQNLTVASAEGDNMMTVGDDAADSVTFSTASEKVGATLNVEARLVNGTAKWLTDAERATPTIAT